MEIFSKWFLHKQILGYFAHAGRNYDYYQGKGDYYLQTKVVSFLKILLIIALNLCMISFISYSMGGASYPSETVETLSRYGSRGDEVTQIQQKLKEWGYYTGEVDGIYGRATEQAVKDFQRKNNLTVDGIAGTQTLLAMGISQNSSSGSDSTGGLQVSDGDYYMLARIISAEARGEPYIGQVAVGAVVLNRVKHPSFPDTVAGVIYQPGAFTAITDGQYNEPIAESSYRAAKEALAGSDPSGGALYYYNPDKTDNQWIRTRPVIKRIGAHLFCS